MTPTVLRLRISLANQPGALAHVAGIIAEHRGNITSLDVQRADADVAVDDLVVEFQGEPDLASLQEKLAASGLASLVSHQGAVVADLVVACLRRLVDLLDGEPGQASEALADSVAEICSSPVVWVSDAEDAMNYDAGRVARQSDGALVSRTTELPPQFAGRLSGELLLLAVPDPETTGGRVVFVARPVSNDFTATEIARIEALMATHARLERLRNGS